MPNLNGKSVDLSLQKTPAKMTSHKEVKPPTPQTPAACVFDQVVQNSPNGRKIHFHSIASKKIGAEMIYLLLRTTDTGDESLKLDRERSLTKFFSLIPFSFILSPRPII